MQRGYIVLAHPPMAKAARSNRKNSPLAPTEWLLGVRTMPTYIVDEKIGSFRPELVLIMQVPHGAILGFEMCKSAELAGAIEKLYRSMLTKIDSGELSPPNALRTSSQEH